MTKPEATPLPCAWPLPRPLIILLGHVHFHQLPATFASSTSCSLSCKMLAWQSPLPGIPFPWFGLPGSFSSFRALFKCPLLGSSISNSSAHLTTLLAVIWLFSFIAQMKPGHFLPSFAPLFISSWLHHIASSTRERLGLTSPSCISKPSSQQGPSQCCAMLLGHWQHTCTPTVCTSLLTVSQSLGRVRMGPWVANRRGFHRRAYERVERWWLAGKLMEDLLLTLCLCPCSSFIQTCPPCPSTNVPVLAILSPVVMWLPLLLPGSCCSPWPTPRLADPWGFMSLNHSLPGIAVILNTKCCMWNPYQGHPGAD